MAAERRDGSAKGSAVRRVVGEAQAAGELPFLRACLLPSGRPLSAREARAVHRTLLLLVARAFDEGLLEGKAATTAAFAESLVASAAVAASAPAFGSALRSVAEAINGGPGPDAGMATARRLLTGS